MSRRTAPPENESRQLPLTAADLLCVALVVAVFSWICFRNIRQPGLYGDEAWAAVEAARFVLGSGPPPSRHSLQLFGHVLPTMLNTYTGPVKAYVLAAGFALFGVSVPVLRSTSGTVGLLGVVALYFLVRERFGRLAAAAAALLAASDLSLVLAVRCDFGPVDFAFFARVASIFLLLAWHRGREHPALLFGGSLLLGLGLSYKFDFLGTIAAVAVGGALFFGRGLRLRAREAAAAAGGFLLGAWPVLLYNVVTRGNTLARGRTLALEASREAFLRAVVHRFEVLRELLGGAIGEFILGERFQRLSPFGGSLVPAAVVLLPLLLGLVFLLPALKPWRRPLGFLLTVFALLLLAVAAVPMALGPHHTLSLYPFPHLFLGVALAALWRAGAAGGLGRAPRLAAAAAFTLLLASNLLLARTFHERLASRGGARYWSESIDDLAAALARDYPGETAELLDWGFEQPLIILGKDRFRLDPVFWRIQQDPDPGPWLAALLHRPDRLFVRRAPRFAFDAKVHERFDDAVRQQRDLAVEERTFFQRDGQPSFSILKFRPANR